MSDLVRDPDRLAAVARSGLMDSDAEEVFDRLTRLASKLLSAPMALISVVDGDRQFFKSAVGSAVDQTPLSHTFCRHVVADGAPLVVSDARQDPRLQFNPAVADGAIAYCGVPLTDPDGHTLGSFCAVQSSPREWSATDLDVLTTLAANATTELQRRAAERHRTQLAQVVESTRDAVGTIDRNGVIISWNYGAELLYGFAATDMVGRSYGEWAERAHGAQVDDAITKCLAGGHVSVHAAPRRRKNGDLIHVDVSAAPLRDEAGQIVGVTAIARDVTAQHRLEQELAHSETRFRKTFDEAPIGVALVGPNGRWLEVNRAMCELVGYSEPELLQLSLHDVTHPDDRRSTAEHVRKVLDGDVSTYQLQKRYVHRDGHVIWVNVSVSVVRDDAGVPLHFISHIEDISEAKAAELALYEGSRLLDESQAVAGVGSWALNLETGGTWWSDEQFRLHGLAPRGTVPLPGHFVELLPPEDRDRVAASMAENMRQRRPFVDEYRVLLPSGARTLQVRGDFLPADPDRGLHPRMTGTTRDVTDERAAEAIRHAVENRQRILLSSLPDTIVALYDTDLRCTLVQGAVQLGVDAEAFEGRLLSELVTAEQFARLEPLITHALRGEQQSLEYASEAGRAFHVDIAPYRSQPGEITGVFTVWRDVTERLERERQTRMLANIVEQSQDAILAKSRQGMITEWNRAAEQLYGYSAEEAVGQPISLIIPPERRGEDRVLLERALAGEALTQFQTERIRKDGRRIDVSISVSPLYGSEDAIIGASVVARDVSERKQMEDDLRASREQALEASRLKSEFVANMSHEIRTPLNGVVSMAELLLGSELCADQREYAEVAMTSAEALMRVINDILDFSKIEAGKLEILSEEFSIRSAVEDVAEIVGVKAVEKGLKLDVTVEDTVADVLRGDGNRIRQVLMNLLSNAVKFTSEGRVSVRVSLVPDPPRDHQLRLEVTDTGIGIDPERLGELFQPFSQADATTTRRYGGTGLGLCISKQLVELMDGALDCQSAPGAGSRFWVQLPYVPGWGGRRDVVDDDLTGTRMLIVADDLAERQGLDRRLASWGISPDRAAGAEAALELLRRAAETGRPYEAALIDNAIPGMTGLELARAIKSVPALRSTRLLLIGACPVDPAEAREGGVDAQVVEPVRQSQLYNQLLNTLRRGGARDHRPEAARGRGSSSPQSALRVLVAEDNEVNQFAAIRLLQTLGLAVDVAKDGREAITMSARRRYAAIFMDCQMPEVDGYTATRVIRAREDGGERTPIIALTAHALEGDRERCLAAGMDDYVAKPLRLAAVEALIERVPALRAQPVTISDGTEVELAADAFDPTALGEIGDPETEAILATMFLDQAFERVPALWAAIQAPDADRVHTLAHGLKGSAATVGANRMSELARTLCELAEGTLSPAAADVHARLANALGQTRAALDEYVARNRTS